MSLNDSLTQTGLGNVSNLPTYCNYHKFLLIEELLCEDYLELHYGKCRVIGKVLRTVTNEYFLENVQITNLTEEYSLPEGTLQLYLLASGSEHPSLENGKYVEALGEVILLNLSEPNSYDAQHLTAKGLQEQLSFQSNAIEKEKLLKFFKRKYIPAIKLWYVSQINRAGDLISRNLEIRMLLDQMRESF